MCESMADIQSPTDQNRQGKNETRKKEEETTAAKYNGLPYWATTKLHPFRSLFSRTTWVSRHQKGKPFWILLAQVMMGWQWHQLDHMQIICTSLQTITMPVHHHSAFTGWRPSCHPMYSVKALKEVGSHKKRFKTTKNSKKTVFTSLDGIVQTVQQFDKRFKKNVNHVYYQCMFRKNHITSFTDKKQQFHFRNVCNCEIC